MASPVKKDVVMFNSVRKSYLPGEHLEVHYILVPDSDLKPASRDWIGLFRVGWSSSRDYYTFEWVTELTNEGKGTAAFAGRRLPPEDKHFYQFCYVSSDGHVRGASSPFQFCAAPVNGAGIDDLELVEVSEDSLMILQPKEKEATSSETESGQKGSNEAEAEESLKWKYEMVERENVQKTEMLEQMDGKVVELQKQVSDLEQQLQAKRDSETRLMEKLEKEKARSHILEAAKTKEEAESAVLLHKVEELKELVKSFEEKNEKVVWENGRLKEATETLSVDLEKSERKMRELQEVQVDLMSQIGEKNEELGQLAMEVEKLGKQLESETEAFQKEKEQILQELAVAQQNITELLGARKEDTSVGVLVNTPNSSVGMVNNDTPPTRPVPREDMVDKTAYEALQQAYENVLEFHHKEAEDNKKLIENFQASKKKIEELENKKEEYRYRIEKCRQEYEAKAREVMELKKATNVSTSADVHDELTALRAKVRDMEENYAQMAKSLDEAIAELTQRKEDLKQKAVKIAEMDEKNANLDEELMLLKQEYEDFQDKHDRVLHEKTAKMDQQQSYMDEKVIELTEQRSVISGLQKEKAKLEATVKQLRSQLDTLKASVRSTEERSCPVCNTKFPRRISQQDFERHVQAHFNTVQ